MKKLLLILLFCNILQADEGYWDLYAINWSYQGGTTTGVATTSLTYNSGTVTGRGYSLTMDEDDDGYSYKKYKLSYTFMYHPPAGEPSHLPVPVTIIADLDSSHYTRAIGGTSTGTGSVSATSQGNCSFSGWSSCQTHATGSDSTLGWSNAYASKSISLGSWSWDAPLVEDAREDAFSALIDGHFNGIQYVWNPSNPPSQVTFDFYFYVMVATSGDGSGSLLSEGKVELDATVICEIDGD